MRQPIPITFYLPKRYWPESDITTNIDSPQIYFLNTSLNWVLQTYLRLRDAGHSVELKADLPPEGVIVSFSGLVSFNFIPNSRQYFVSISADAPAHPFANMHIVQNMRQSKRLRNAHFVQHWPQPLLVPRDTVRGTRFEHAVYYGDEVNLTAELQTQAWRDSVANLGLTWTIRGDASPLKASFADADVIVAVRSFQKSGFVRKPASKLFNAWIAGIPAILGAEFAYQEQRKSQWDYIEVHSVEEALQALRLLAASPELRNRIIENGRLRAKEVTVSAITEHWRAVLFDSAVAGYHNWCKDGALTRSLHYARCIRDKKVRGIYHRTLRRLGQEHNSI
jgi:hypothetical protein